MKKCFSRVFIKDDSGDILVLRDRKGGWNLPGGKQEAWESPIDCAIREVKEETALEISNLEEVYSNVLIFDDIKWTAHFYFANVSKGKPVLNERNKIKGIQFIDDLNIVNFSVGLDPLFAHLKKTKILENKITKWK
ncbi:NUDIX hydrolase [Enterococcus faecalis]|uniref:NUDIX hydrolase n=1 Tax=Enterococcus TaxID=1350 RepID=UPI000CF17BCC|nr:NUDIX hydrolase [Enterococcus faecalis]EGO5066418.1 NUDIX hydrolase [Enterococcus faecalis]EGO5077162.1 NUDIX hydrolase [Enterococcus faecalis]EGO5984745.1 NUDIX hydrolase [Enterococcus faecalis]EGO7986414.1 NUDIX hydrolase [Enterococcus faecalis]EGO8139407.1 NUDIX hydrolase [Enterococcus faecalis]